MLRMTICSICIGICIAFLLTSTRSYARCSDDLAALKPRIERIKFSDKPRYAVANKWFGEAEKAKSYDEVQCRNYYTRASRALTQPMDGATKNGVGSNRSSEGSSVVPVAPVGPITEDPARRAPPTFTPPKPNTFPKPSILTEQPPR